MFVSLMRSVSCGGSKKYLTFGVIRTLSTTSILNGNSGGEGWLSKLLHVRKIEPTKDSHSKLLSDTERVYELQIHDVKPDCIEAYLKGYEALSQHLNQKSEPTELVGSWRVEIGNQDQFIHIWRYNRGYANANQVLTLCREDQELKALSNDLVKNIITRNNQYMLPFSFWGDPQPQNRSSMYEMRSYVLKPGTMIEWGNNWARGINYRKSSAVAGFFSQIGQLYMVHHIWNVLEVPIWEKSKLTKDLMSRKEYREAAWRKPGWDECVAYTVPLIREMRSRWLRPTSFSPIK
ncbi:protein NipSnap [Caerostris extrusa]|uniref:Protein NipSnap n=1 Tax=Caerostris extrusa TaxID=172846 RepID=A0AAV4WSU2_CAEEX|nr:protein NipSnap [Caerostris extrusa]